MANVDLTLNRFAIANMPSFQNEFGVKKTNPKQGCSTAENTTNMMLPFLRQRPIAVTSNMSTSTVEANAAINLIGNISSLTLGPGSYKGVELAIINDANDDVIITYDTRTITTKMGDNIVLRWDGNEWRIKHDFLVGDFYEQLPSAKSPIEKCLEGMWVNWSSRAVLYGISNAAPVSHVNYNTIVGTTIAANARPVVMYHLSGSDYQLFRFKQSTTAYVVTAQLDPVRWDEIAPDIVGERETCQKLSTRVADQIQVTADLQIGHQISGGIHSGKWITAVYVLGGKFISVAGGNRPPFITGGISSHILDQPNVPDYAAQQTINRFSTTAFSGSWTNDQGDGFVNIYYGISNTANDYIRINGVNIFSQRHSGSQPPLHICVPIKNGDVITYSTTTDSLWRAVSWCFFIPPLSTGNRIDTISKLSWRRVA